MNLADVNAIASGLPNAEPGKPFRSDTRTWHVGGKNFLFIRDQTDPLHINVKTDPDQARKLRKDYAAIQPGYHMNKKYWSTIVLDGSVPQGLVKELIERSYHLVLGET
jgi:predicted DNA-binding protein (MmcQ/YjbR family)